MRWASPWSPKASKPRSRWTGWALGCDQGQGFLIGKPLTAKQVSDALAGLPYASSSGRTAITWLWERSMKDPPPHARARPLSGPDQSSEPLVRKVPKLRREPEVTSAPPPEPEVPDVSEPESPPPAKEAAPEALPEPEPEAAGTPSPEAAEPADEAPPAAAEGDDTLPPPAPRRRKRQRRAPVLDTPDD